MRFITKLLYINISLKIDTFKFYATVMSVNKLYRQYAYINLFNQFQHKIYLYRIFNN